MKKILGEEYILTNNIIAGSVAGAITSFLTLPLDVIKTRS